MFLEKRSEAGLIKAANVSDVMVIDNAKDTGGGRIGPDTQLNYVMAVMVGGLIPLTFVFFASISEYQYPQRSGNIKTFTNTYPWVNWAK